MPLEVLRSLPRPALGDDELSPATDCSEDSVEIRSPTLFRPTAISPLKRSSAFLLTQQQQQHAPDTKRMRPMLDAGYLASVTQHRQQHPAFLVPPIDDRWMAPWLRTFPAVPEVMTMPPFYLLHPLMMQHAGHPLPPPLFHHHHHHHSTPLFQHQQQHVASVPPEVMNASSIKNNKPIDIGEKCDAETPEPAAAAPEKLLPLDKPKSSFLSVDTILGRTESKITESSVKLDSSPSSKSDAEPPQKLEQPQKTPTALAGSHHSSLNRTNYKNMTRERRMQANARERTRVHTISAAFEALRKAVPSFSHGQRLSKLSILRVASAYIGALSKLANESDDSEADLSDCVDRCTRTLMTEGQMLRKKRPTQSNHDSNQNQDDEIEVDDDFDDE